MTYTDEMDPGSPSLGVVICATYLSHTHSSFTIDQIAAITPLLTPLIIAERDVSLSKNGHFSKSAGKPKAKSTISETPPGAKVSSKNHHKTMIFGVPEAEILRTPIKIEKLSVWSVTFSEFIVNFEFHGFLEKKTPF